MSTPLYSALRGIRQKLQKTGHQLVIAESCTAGLAAAKLGMVPGISEVFCGSQVVYQTAIKTAWLGIDPVGLSDPTRGPVSEWASRTLTEALLDHTPAATVAAAVTGHLGPIAPQELDGDVFFAIRFRHGEETVAAFRLESPPPSDSEDIAGRALRQSEAAERFLSWIEAGLRGEA